MIHIQQHRGYSNSLTTLENLLQIPTQQQPFEQNKFFGRRSSNRSQFKIAEQTFHTNNPQTNKSTTFKPHGYINFKAKISPEEKEVQKITKLQKIMLPEINRKQQITSTDTRNSGLKQIESKNQEQNIRYKQIDNSTILAVTSEKKQSLQKHNNTRVNPDLLFRQLKTSRKYQTDDLKHYTKLQLETVTLSAIMCEKKYSSNQISSHNQKNQSTQLDSKFLGSIQSASFENQSSLSVCSTICMDQIQIEQAYAFHDLNMQNRAKMLDWMIQVFRVLNKNLLKTYILASQIMDRYFIMKYQKRIKVPKYDLHIVGLIAIFLSSKYEDVHPISMEQILFEAAHGKFDKQDIIERELDVLQTLDFKLHYTNFYEEAVQKFKIITAATDQSKHTQISKLIEEEILKYMQFFCYLIIQEPEILINDISDLSTAILLLAIRISIQKNRQKIFEQQKSKSNFSEDLEIYLTTQQINECINQKALVSTLTNETQTQMTQLIQHIIKQNLTYQKRNPNLKNLQRSFPKYISESHLHLISNCSDNIMN
ncbi:UNKNOWN [Stylonychia lemnae]|uniref:Cyclin-like domain-containing protein n=1 Tax=Stylonychia lemnae TaxID=5949 RepID=A0A077ZU78_STYLE|nr:UNKNOWN [Stylonychia lemnae]|eukprot:CDW72840.1 UNKNOWN [Stylonychia lemnae]